jgi:hypothetical protein
MRHGLEPRIPKMGKNTWKWEKNPVLVQMRKIFTKNVRKPLYLIFLPK